jgi:hypothetical protein
MTETIDWLVIDEIDPTGFLEEYLRDLGVNTVINPRKYFLKYGTKPDIGSIFVYQSGTFTFYDDNYGEIAVFNGTLDDSGLYRDSEAYSQIKWNRDLSH